MSTKIQMEIPCKIHNHNEYPTHNMDKSERQKKKKIYHSYANSNDNSNKEQPLHEKERYGTLICVVSNNEKNNDCFKKTELIKIQKHGTNIKDAV